MELSIIDVKILAFVDKREFATINEINRKMRFDCSDRISHLSDFIEPEITGYNDASKLSSSDIAIIGVFPIYSDRYHLTETGKRILQDYKSVDKDKKRKEVLYWIRYSFTTLIAILALVNSILARLGL